MKHKMTGFNKASKKRHYGHTKQGGTVRQFPGSAMGSHGIAREKVAGQIAGKRVSRKHNRKS